MCGCASGCASCCASCYASCCDSMKYMFGGCPCEDASCCATACASCSASCSPPITCPRGAGCKDNIAASIKCHGFEATYTELLNQKHLTEFEKTVIRQRYIKLVASMETSSRWITFLYLTLTNSITISGVLIASLTPLEKASVISKSGATAIFWIILGLSIALTLANKWLHVFNINKKYVLGSAALEKFYAEGWHFMSGIGRYSNLMDGDQYAMFCTRVERLKLKHVESIAAIDSESNQAEILSFAPNPRAGATRGHELTEVVVDSTPHAVPLFTPRSPKPTFVLRQLNAGEKQAKQQTKKDEVFDTTAVTPTTVRIADPASDIVFPVKVSAASQVKTVE